MKAWSRVANFSRGHTAHWTVHYLQNLSLFGALSNCDLGVCSCWRASLSLLVRCVRWIGPYQLRAVSSVTIGQICPLDWRWDMSSTADKMCPVYWSVSLLTSCVLCIDLSHCWRAVSCVLICVTVNELCPVYWSVSCVLTCVIVGELCPVYWPVSLLTSCVLCIDLCPVYWPVSLLASCVLYTGLCHC